MRAEGIQGVVRTKRVRTTRPAPASARHPDLVKRDFTAKAPNQLWVTDLTYVPTFARVAYVCFIIDVFSRMIVGWRVASHMRTDLSRWSAEEMRAVEAERNSRPRKVLGWKTQQRPSICVYTCSTKAVLLPPVEPCQYRSIRFTEHLQLESIAPSIGSVWATP